MVKSLAKETKTLCETILFWKTIIPPLMFIVVNMRVFSLKNNSMNIQGVREQDCNVFKLIVFSKILCINAVSAVKFWKMCQRINCAFHALFLARIYLFKVNPF